MPVGCKNSIQRDFKEKMRLKICRSTILLFKCQVARFLLDGSIVNDYHFRAQIIYPTNSFPENGPLNRCVKLDGGLNEWRIKIYAAKIIRYCEMV